MNGSSPHERYRTSRLRQAARTLAVSGESAADNDDELEGFVVRQRIDKTDKPTRIQVNNEKKDILQFDK